MLSPMLTIIGNAAAAFGKKKAAPVPPPPPETGWFDLPTLAAILVCWAVPLVITVLLKRSEKKKPRIGLAGLAVMGQNLALNIASKGFDISVYNRSTDKTDQCVARAAKEIKEGAGKLKGYHELKDFVASIAKPRAVIILVKAGAPVDALIAGLKQFMEPGDIIIDGGNEWYENTERRQKAAMETGLIHLGMGVSGGEEGARNGPSMMPGGDESAYKVIEDILLPTSAQTDSGACVTYIGPGGSGNFVKMVHNGIEYGDMQLISEAYDVLKTVGGLTNDEMAAAFNEWNNSELGSFLIEISALILSKKDDKAPESGKFLVDLILDKTGMKGTGKWTVQQGADLSIAAPTMATSLDARFISGLKENRVKCAAIYEAAGLAQPTVANVDKKQLVADVRAALYCAKVCSYAQGMNLIRAKSDEQGWNLKLGELARIWKGGCIIRAVFLDRIKTAYDNNPTLPSLLEDPAFVKELVERQESWRRAIRTAVMAGVALPSTSGSLAYFDSYRRGRLPANMVQAQRDFFGSHTYERTDMPGSHHTIWDAKFSSADSITTSGYNN